MDNIDSLCMNCFSPLTQGAVCGECGFNNEKDNDITYLPVKTTVNNRFIIGTVMEHESDAVVYSAYDTVQEESVLVREFLPKGIANRLEGNKDVHVRERFRKNFESYKTSFLALWRTFAKMRSLSAVVPVIDIFEENETAYGVTQKVESVSLREFLLKMPDGNVSWDKVRLMFMPVLTTLETLHQNGIIHGSITPDNLLLCPDGRMRLKGFCITECNTVNSELEFNLNDGYTAIEQYDNNHKMCPATDIYAFSACIYRALVGSNPPSAPNREQNDKLMIPNRIAESIPTHVIKALGFGLQIYPEKRCQTITRFRELLNATPNVVAAAAPSEIKEEPIKHKEVEKKTVEKKKQSPQEKEGKNGKIIAIVLVVLILLAIGAGVYVVKYSGLASKQEEITTQSVAKVTVPNFTSAGYDQSDIENNGVWNSQFKFKYVSEYSDEYEEGIIFKQSVTAGESIDEGSEITLTVSKGVEMVTVPDVGGQTLEDATKALEKLGLKVSSVSVSNDGAHTEGTVKSDYGIAPSDGTSVAVGTEIILQVYSEPVVTTQATTAPTTTSAEE